MTRRTLRSTARRIAAAALFALAGGAFAFGPEDAFRAAVAFEDQPAQTRLDRARQEFDRARLGLGGSLEATPAVGYGGDIGEPAEAFLDLEAEARFGYRYDAIDILDEEIDLLQAVDNALEERRERIREYLDIHGDLLRLQLRVEDRREDLERQRARLENIERDPDATEFELERARIRVDEAASELDVVQRAVRNQREIAVSLGLEGPATWSLLEFDLPDPDATATTSYQILEARVASAELRALRDGVFRTVDRIALDGIYESRSDGYQVGIGASLDRGRPGVEVSAEYDNQGGDRWRIVLSADLVLDTDTVVDAERAQRDVELARAELADYVARFPLRAESARVALQADYAAFEIERRELALVEGRAEELATEARELRQRLAELERAADTDDTTEPSTSDLETLRFDLERLEARRLDVASDIRDERDDVYDAWLDYLVEVEDYLDVIEVPWVLGDDG